MKIKYVCNTCGIENQVVVSGTFSWDYETQDWLPNDLSGDRPICSADNCFSEDIDEVKEE